MREAEAMVRLTFFPFYSWSFCQKLPGLCWDVWRGATRCTFESNVLIMQPVFVVRTWHNEKATNMGKKKMWQEWCVVASHFWDVCLTLTPNQLLRLVPLSKLLDATFLWCWTELLETLQPCSHFEILTLFLIWIGSLLVPALLKQFSVASIDLVLSGSSEAEAENAEMSPKKRFP